MDLLTYDNINQDPFATPLTNQLIEKQLIWNREIALYIKQQIYELQNYGFNVLKDYNIQILDIDLFRDIIQYCDESYANISNIDDILSNELKINIIGKYIYNFYAVKGYDVFKSTAKLNNISIMELYLTHNCRQLVIEYLTETVINSYKLNQLKTPNYELLFYIDMIDSDITLLIENWLIPLTVNLE